MPAASKSKKPAPKKVVKKVAAKAVSKPAAKAKPVAKKAPAKPAAKTSAKPVAKAPAKPAAKTASKSATKTAPKSATKATSKVVAKPAAKAAPAKAPAKKPAVVAHAPKATGKKAAKSGAKGKAGKGLDDTDLSDIESDLEGEEVASAEKVKPLRMKISKAKERALMKEFGLDETVLSEEDMAKRRAMASRPGGLADMTVVQLREFGADPVSGKPVVGKEGRFGDYVTDGETNAGLTRGDRMEAMTNERAYELLQLRQENFQQHQADVYAVRWTGGPNAAGQGAAGGPQAPCSALAAARGGRCGDARREPRPGPIRDHRRDGCRRDGRPAERSRPGASPARSAARRTGCRPAPARLPRSAGSCRGTPCPAEGQARARDRSARRRPAHAPHRLRRIVQWTDT